MAGLVPAIHALSCEAGRKDVDARDERGHDDAASTHSAAVAAFCRISSGVDSTTYDTTSIMATIEHSFGLAPVAPRDAGATDLTAAVRMGDPRHHGSDAD